MSEGTFADLAADLLLKRVKMTLSKQKQTLILGTVM